MNAQTDEQAKNVMPRQPIGQAAGAEK